VANGGRGDERGVISNQYSVFCRGPPASPFGQPLAGCLAPLGCIQIGEGRLAGRWGAGRRVGNHEFHGGHEWEGEGRLKIE